MVSSKSSNEQKHDFTHHKRKLIVSLIICHKESIKNLIIFLLITNQNYGMILNPLQLFLGENDSEHFNLLNLFLLSLVIYFSGSQFNLLRMSCYKFMTPFRDHTHLVINKCFYPFHYSFPGIDNIANE